jgi:hypothetical protein
VTARFLERSLPNDFVSVGGGAVHYDVALGAVEESPDSVSAILPRSWRQLLR